VCDRRDRSRGQDNKRQQIAELSESEHRAHNLLTLVKGDTDTDTNTDWVRTYLYSGMMLYIYKILTRIPIYIITRQCPKREQGQ